MFTPTNLVTYVSGERNYSRYDTIQLRLSDYEFIEYPVNMQNGPGRFTQFLSYTPGRGERQFALTALYKNKEISNIMKKLHEVFTRFENQKNKVG